MIRTETDETRACSGCGRLSPPSQMTSMPRGEWLCDVCYGYGDEDDYDEGRVKERLP